MFKKVLVAEDFDSINIAVKQALEHLNVEFADHAKYGDDAFIKIKKALHDNKPYDLLISDLSFLPDGRENTIASGEDLIQAVRTLQPDMKIIVYSVEDKPFRIKSLFDKFGISAYVFKGRNSIVQLGYALQCVFKNEVYISPELAHVRNNQSANEIDDYDLELLKLLALGLKQEAIANKFKDVNITPNSISAVEKRISRLKIYFRANNNVQIVVMAKDLGFI